MSNASDKKKALKHVKFIIVQMVQKLTKLTQINNTTMMQNYSDENFYFNARNF